MIAVNAWQKEIEGYTTIVGTVTPFGQLGIDYSTLPIATQTGIQNTANAQCGCTTGNPAERERSCRPAPEHQRADHARGWELTYVQPLDFLLQGAGFTVNYTHIDQKSEGGLPGAPSSAITGLSPFTYNVTAFYENYRILGPPDVLGA